MRDSLISPLTCVFSTASSELSCLISANRAELARLHASLHDSTSRAAQSKSTPRARSASRSQQTTLADTDSPFLVPMPVQRVRATAASASARPGARDASSSASADRSIDLSLSTSSVLFQQAVAAEQRNVSSNREIERLTRDLQRAVR